MQYYVRRTKNPYWAWWAEQWKIPSSTEDVVWDFLCGAAPAVTGKAPDRLPPSKVFRGTGVAILNTDLTSASANVQVRFKASPMGRWSHGHDPHNSFTLNAYGEALLVNNVYRDLYGSPFHRDWVWSTRAQNAVLVNGAGQKAHSADLGGRIVHAELADGLDYVVGDATASYEGKLTAARRHVIFLKPDVVVLADELAAPRPSTYQWMLHAQKPFEVRGGHAAADGGTRTRRSGGRLRGRRQAPHEATDRLRSTAGSEVSRIVELPADPAAVARGSRQRNAQDARIHADRPASAPKRRSANGGSASHKARRLARNRSNIGGGRIPDVIPTHRGRNVHRGAARQEDLAAQGGVVAWSETGHS